MSPETGEGERASATAVDPARRRAATETYARHEASLRRTARRFSICADDAEDALQRALEILLRKAPCDDPGELVKWTLTVVRHEALAVRRERERLLAGPAASGGEGEDWVTRIPAEAAGPAERVERHEAIARSREALRALKPHELRALTLLAEGYSYSEISEITGFSRSKVNHCVARGRERFRKLIARSENGSRCRELSARLSAFCDGELEAEEADAVHEHLRACARCRATLRAYRTVPAAAAALAPALPLHRSLLDRAGEALAGLGSRLGGGDATLAQVAGAGGARGAGTMALAKTLALCVGTVGGAAACVATGVVPAPLGVADGPAPRPERAAKRLDAEPESPPVNYAPAPEPAAETQPETADPELTPIPPEPTATSGAVEYTPSPAPEPAPAAGGGGGGGSGSATGEFGP